MIFQKLELHIAQVEKTISLSRKDFSNHPKKQAVYDNLIELFTGIKNSNYQAFSLDDLILTKETLALILSSIQFLHYSDEREIPKRLIYCLNQVLNDWVENGTEKYYIVISYDSDVFKFNYLDESKVKPFNSWVTTMFNVSYKPSLIKISKPKYLFDDFLGSTPVYHELGHFIDNNFQIIVNLFNTDPGFAAQNNIDHYKEYFADVFAAQYIGTSCIEPLNYISPRTMNIPTKLHPSNQSRIAVVKSFLNGSGDDVSNKIVEQLKKAVALRDCGELKIRNVNFINNPFELVKPISLEDTNMTHTLFSEGWLKWLDSNSKIRKTYPNPVECCNVMNDIIKSSIEMTIKTHHS